MKANIKNIFETYANHSLRDNPENIYKILHEIEQHFYMDYDKLKELAHLMANLYVESVKQNDPDLCEKYYNDLVKSKPEILGDPFYVPIKSLSDDFFRYRNYPGQTKECYGSRCSAVRKTIFNADLFSGPDRLNCVECDQLYFQYIVHSLAEGREYNQIRGFVFFKDNATKAVSEQLEFDSAPEGSPFKIELKKFLRWNTGITYSFRTFLEGAVSYSLMEFLLNNDRRLLKYCERERCKKFFVPDRKDFNRKYCQLCTRKDNRTREQNRLRQRERRARKKELKEKQIYEARIENFMKRAGCTREQAEEYIKADLELSKSV